MNDLAISCQNNKPKNNLQQLDTMHIYNLDDASFFQHDLEEIFDRIGNIYEIDFKSEPFIFKSKINLGKDVFWASAESAQAFNIMVPVIKSLIKDIYSIIESLHVSYKGKFDKPEAEQKYPRLKELRLLNNKLKHFKTKEAEIALISVVHIYEHKMDFMIQFRYSHGLEVTTLGDLIRPFFLIMEEIKAITIDRNEAQPDIQKICKSQERL